MRTCGLRSRCVSTRVVTDVYVGFAESCDDYECGLSIYEATLDRLNNGFVSMDKLDRRLDRLIGAAVRYSKKCDDNVECSLTSVATKRNTLNRMNPSRIPAKRDSLNRLDSYPLVKRDSLDRLIGIPLKKRDSLDRLNRAPLVKRDSLDRLIGIPLNKRDSLDRLNRAPLVKRDSLDRLIGVPLEKRDSLDRLNSAPLVKRDSLDNTDHAMTTEQDNSSNRFSDNQSMAYRPNGGDDVQNMIDRFGPDSPLLVHQSLQRQRQQKSNYRLHQLDDFALFKDNQDYYDVNDCIGCSSIESTSF